MKITKLSNGGELYKNNNGDKHYFLNGIHHREDGPAMEHDGVKSWWINGELLPCKTQKQFEQLMRLKLFW
jgi:hypothetical protein